MMKKAMVLTLCMAVTAFFGSACGGHKQVKDDGPEVLLPGQFVESIDANIDVVKCTGKGPDQKTAFLQARKGCLEWMIVEKLAQDPAERQAYLANQKDIMAKLDRYVDLIKPGARSGRGLGVKKQLRIDDDTIMVEANVKVFKKQLMDDLVAMNIIASKDEMIAGTGGATVVVLPSKAVRAKAYRKEMEAKANDYLISNKWEVIDLDGAANFDKLKDAMVEASETEEDEMANLASAAGADIFLVVEATPEKGKAGDEVWKASVWGYETTTKRKLASKVAFSDRRYSDTAGRKAQGMIDALGDAMGQVMPQISAYWKEDSKKGNKFRVIFKNNPKNTDIKMKGVFNKACGTVKIVRALPKTTEFYLQCKGDATDLSGAIIDGIEAKLGGGEYDRLQNRNSIIITFK